MLFYPLSYNDFQRATCIRSQKTESCFSPISSDKFIRRLTQVYISGIYLTLTVAMVTKMANKTGLKFKI